jgi:hypothetical protein
MIEQYHRTIKQVCHIEHFQVRGKVAIKNHLFAAFVAMCNCSDYFRKNSDSPLVIALLANNNHLHLYSYLHIIYPSKLLLIRVLNENVQ